MSLAQITDKIERDARDEAARILERARGQEAEIKTETENEVKRIEASAAERFDDERPEIFKRREIVARLDVSKIRLGAERRLISDVFEEALLRLKNLGRDEYVSFCERLLKEGVESGDERVEVSRSEKYLDEAWLEAFNKANGFRLTLSGSRGDFSGGFILSKGRIAVNCTWEMLIQSASERMENEVVRRLFSD
ncbi:MAG: V-type ATP synthase subunit E [Synergistaceae bacterium]|jgi:V/A-type H+-transporting ATPase subunit E|nr:V-type ATP synthase subunit E [Synergistaceae bacterium]